MQTMEHAAATGPTPQRIAGFIFVGLLHVVLISALIIGLRVKLLPAQPPETQVVFPHHNAQPQPAPSHTELIDPTQTAVVPQPTITIENPDQGPTITAVVAPVSTGSDHPARAVADTHTTPPYPAMEQRLGIEGTVQLRLTISPQGFVTEAVVLRSSGSEGLDQAARNWVLAHWRYQPAVRGGVAVPSSTDVAVKFDLKRAG